MRTEELLERIAREAGARIMRGVEVRRVRNDGADTRLQGVVGDEPFEAVGRFVVGCDGGRSVVREQAGIAWTGVDVPFNCMFGDVILANPPGTRVASGYTEHGWHLVVPISAEQHRVILISYEPAGCPVETPLPLAEFAAQIETVIGHDLGPHSPTWLTRNSGASYQAERYRAQNILLAGDAAHIHVAMGGQGMNLGIHDATNLGWKLAAVVHGKADSEILDTYEDEREPVGARVIEDTLAQTALATSSGPQADALRRMFCDLLAHDATVIERLAHRITGLDVTYASAGDDHPAVGRRMPNLELSDGRRAHELLAHGRFVAIGPGLSPSSKDRSANVVSAGLRTDEYGAPWRDLGTVLIRPDGHVAWAADRADERPESDLWHALARWLATPASPVVSQRA